MSTSVILVLIGLFLLVVVFVGVSGLLAAKRRRETMSTAATEHGWRYLDRDDRWAERWEGAPFGRGFDRRADNVLSGVYDHRPFVAFDYRYSTRETSTDANGNTTTHVKHHPYSVVAIDTAARFPELAVAPEGFFGRIVGRVTNREIDLESEEFNRAFSVRCPDRRFASNVLHPQMMEYLIGHPELAWRFADASIVAVEQGRHTVAEVETTLGAIDGVVDRVPEFVWREVGVVDPGRPA